MTEWDLFTIDPPYDSDLSALDRAATDQLFERILDYFVIEHAEGQRTRLRAAVRPLRKFCEVKGEGGV